MRGSTTAVLVAMLVVGCGESDKTARPLGGATTGGEVSDAGRCIPTAPNHEVTEYDTSGDEIPDVRKLFVRTGEENLERTVLICREADLNGDGVKDVVRFYTKEGRPEREEADRDFDGRIDEVTHFTGGRIALQELDSNGSGIVDTKIFYEGGQPVRAERDVAGRSTADAWHPDRWEYYEDGRTVRVGADIDGDGKVDRWDRDEERLRKSALAQEEAAQAAAAAAN